MVEDHPIGRLSLPLNLAAEVADPCTTSMRSRVAIYSIFALSGAAGLTYQVLWARWLSLVMGSTTVSVSVVLSSFMLGLALGSWLAGRQLTRVRKPLAIYGWLELGVGAFAVAFPVFHGLCDTVFTTLVSAHSPLAWNLLVRVVLAFTVLVVPTTLMGATLPMMTEYFRREAERGTTWKAGLLYALNTLGAALGTVGASFLAIEHLGVRDTSLLAASINLGVGLWALRRSNTSEVGTWVSADPTELSGAGLNARLALGILAMSGAAALA